jgi:decaprenylphospho-beta-D-erythro-pentofuranosid-2-ulose 2-reductase
VAQQVARVEAQRGARLYLVGRDSGRLQAFVADLARDGAIAANLIQTRQADFLDFAAARTVIQAAFDALGRIDRVYVAHGDLGDQLLSERDYSEAVRIFEVNCLSVIALLIPLAERMEKEARGSVTVITSVAADRGRPRNFTYGAAKAALNIYLQGLRSRLYASGVRITTIRLGPVDTPMTRSHEKNAVFSSAPAVAKLIVNAQANSDVYVPGFWRWIMLIVRNLPLPLFQRLGFLSGR